MSAEIALWRVDGEAKRVKPSSMPLESRLEEIIESDPAMLGQQLMLIGRQVATAYGKFIDLLAVDGDGYLHVIELKRDRTPRDVVAQVLDYGSWVQGLSNDDVREIHANYRNSDAGSDSFDEAFERSFGTNAPESLNGSHVLTVVASEMDPATERLVTYLAGGYDVPINVLFFAYYEDEGRKYIARTWLIDDSTIAANKSVSERQEQTGSLERAGLVRELRRGARATELGGRAGVRIRVGRRQVMVLTHTSPSACGSASVRVPTEGRVRRRRRSSWRSRTVRGSCHQLRSRSSIR